MGGEHANHGESHRKVVLQRICAFCGHPERRTQDDESFIVFFFLKKETSHMQLKIKIMNSWVKTHEKKCVFNKYAFMDV